MIITRCRDHTRDYLLHVLGNTKQGSEWDIKTRIAGQVKWKVYNYDEKCLR